MVSTPVRQGEAEQIGLRGRDGQPLTLPERENARSRCASYPKTLASEPEVGSPVRSNVADGGIMLWRVLVDPAETGHLVTTPELPERKTGSR